MIKNFHVLYVGQIALDNVGRDDIAIGMDVLRKLRLYVAYGERKLYVTPATAPAAAPSPAPAQ